MSKKYTFSDLDASMSVDISGNFNILYDEETIIQSIKIIFATISGERVRNPIGSTLIKLLFEPMTEYTAFAIGNIATDAISKYEPRVSITDIKVTPLYDQNIYDVQIKFWIKKLNKSLVFKTKLNSMYA